MKVGIIGAGGIAKKMAETLNGMGHMEAYAIAARDLSRAEAFAKEHHITKAYGSYEEMLSDPEVKLVYVATPHSHHYEHITLSLEHNKHVLCEKAFTANATQAKKVLTLAKEKNLLLAEAIWTRYTPSCKILQKIIESGVIGEATSLSASLGYAIDHVPRIMDLNLAGGSLLDLTVYPINFAMMLFGNDIKSISSSCVIEETGVDTMDSVTFVYNDGKIAQLFTTVHSNIARLGIINGSKGYIMVDNINNPMNAKVFDLSHTEIASHDMPKQITGFEYQVDACVKAINSGKLECEEMPHSEILRVMEICDDLRKEWGIEFPFKK
ncbi:MAG: Gfo/Idh/MocA family oxidoreductase [Bacillota bacterium]